MNNHTTNTSTDSRPGTVYLIPVPLSEGPLDHVLPAYNVELLAHIRHFVVENVRSARRFLKLADRSIDIDSLHFYELNKHSSPEDVGSYLHPLEEGEDVGMISEAGCPAVADPGALLVAAAHRAGYRVCPLIGPSSILLALMSSGFNGQSFSFHGYLPIDERERRQALQQLEQAVDRHGSAQIFIETPYRNEKLVDDLCRCCKPSTLLCIASDITGSRQMIKTQSLGKWKKHKPELHKIPTIFILGK
ncbi:SAM-dependent methyltransferase [Porphyromonas crevioricanis]|uniref:Ribosomal RNA small subunit methyltransferase I n=2 Tax=Porphyromonas crevioricanis TaxID=393921 RepID=A0A2X4SR93_9PORP|nr:SAM-dependent methyltransferase [Porphyromonas crevioricanis]SJZ78833.1 16S rRNA (cytidine1402-2'-O)-methyltransferase [Porphyromonas crevioricanis]SQH72411.1 Ribosomal RNA small subunit methyltransferase I [Porphyromonas crevioricanis]